MLRLIAVESGTGEPTGSVTLTLEQRLKSRQRVCLDDGTPAAVLLARGTVLRNGDCLRSEDGCRQVVVWAAAEPVSMAYCANPRLLARASYHLGNRHVRLQVGEGWLRYQRDHVLDDMLRGLGLTVVAQAAPFEPELGAYAAHEH